MQASESLETRMIDSALRAWKSTADQIDKFFGALSPEQLEQEIAPGRNRLIYLWGHIAALNDGLSTRRAGSQVVPRNGGNVHRKL